LVAALPCREFPHQTCPENTVRGELSFQNRNFLQNPFDFDVNVRHFGGHFAVVFFVFIHIPASNVIN